VVDERPFSAVEVVDAEKRSALATPSSVTATSCLLLELEVEVRDELLARARIEPLGVLPGTIECARRANCT